MPIRNFGVRWNYDYSAWGRLRPRSPAVDFTEQIGIYLLYKNDKLIYVGRSSIGGSRIGARLAHHYSYGDNAGKWDAFTWFGFKPVVDGKLQTEIESAVSYESEIRDIEALLIFLLSLGTM